MSLTPGTRLGPYEIVGALGAGGMGEVYRATDTKLKRDVAIKVLPASLVSDPDRLARFQREAEVLAALNHPNIAAIYGIESSATQALVMELVEGEDLSHRIAQGAMPIEDALPIAKQIAEALEAAHEQGIVHRDLKPANIKVRQDGTVKVLDFGLAKAMDPNVGRGFSRAGNGAAGATPYESPTMTSPALTQMGIVLGTAAYMAPEQAKGRPVDRRADIWAFGVVLYEMLTDRQLFQAETVGETLAAVLRGDIDLGALPDSTPPRVRRLVARCLDRDPKTRLQHIGEARIALGRDSSDESATGVVPSPPPARSSRLRQAGLPVATAIVAVAATWVVTRPTPVETPRVEFSVPVPPDVAIRRGPGSGVELSPDGRLLLFVGDPVGKPASMLYLRRLDADGVTPLQGTEGGFAPFFSPDSRWIAFFTDTQIMRMPVAGGRPSPVGAKGQYSRGTWLRDDTLLLGTSLVSGGGGLGRVPASGGTPAPFTTVADGDRLHQAPFELPDGRHVLFSVHNQSSGQLAVASLESGEYRLLGLEGSNPQVVASSSLLFVRDGALFVAPFDQDRLEVTGPEASILPEAHTDNFGSGVARAALGLDRAGDLAYLPHGGSNVRRLSWITTSGVEDPTGLEPAPYASVRVAQDGKRFVVGVSRPDAGGRMRIRVVDAVRGLPLDLEADGSNPIWGPGGSLVFTTSKGLGRVPADNSQPAAPFLIDNTLALQAQDWSPDDRRLVISSMTRGGNRGASNRDLSVVVPGADRRALVDSDADEVNARISPDGRWLAYESTASGRTRVYVRPFDAPGGLQPVSSEGATQPVWARDGRALYFLKDGAMMKVSVQSSPFALGTASELFTLSGSVVAYDVAPDGRFLIVLGPRQGADAIRVVLGWRAPGRGR